MITIVTAHPYDKSFNRHIFESIGRQYLDLGREYQVIDLYADGFSPVMSLNDLAGFSKGVTDDALVKRYQDMLQHTEHIIFIFPIWWGMMPAMINGFFDRVFLKGVIYDTAPGGALMPCLDIKKTTVITTSESPTEMFEPFFDGYLPTHVFDTVGMNGMRWFNCDRITSGTDEHRQAFLISVLAYLAE
ncbi:MAG: NAD(P)H-dependent oxidoreductase [Muribaculaceae bacterium]|nr:NAD(P)H-dependent oxidoreductase [Muribaculaceae bacterium]